MGELEQCRHFPRFSLKRGNRLGKNSPRLVGKSQVRAEGIHIESLNLS